MRPGAGVNEIEPDLGFYQHTQARAKMGEESPHGKWIVVGQIGKCSYAAEQKLRDTRQRYNQMYAAMKNAEAAAPTPIADTSAP